LLIDRPYLLVALGCLAVAALSLLGPHQPTYDPWAWLVWGREIAHGDLNTVGGPSWKPFPLFFTTPASLAGDAAPQLWLVIARAGFLLGLAAAWRLAASLAGWMAGLVAAAGIVLCDRFLSLALRGDSEGILAGFALGAVVLHRDGRRGAALAAAVAACLVRPEVWPFAAAYGLWLWLRGVEPARRARIALLLGAAGVLVLAAWFVPEKVGSGSLLRGASRAREPVANSPAQASFPFLAVFTNSSNSLAIPIYAGGFLAVGLAAGAWRRARESRAGTVLLLAAAATAYMVIVGVLAQSGFTGNQRYVLLPATLVCVLGGVGLAWAVEAARAGGPRAWMAALAVVLLGGLALAISPARRLGRQLDRAEAETQLYDDLGETIDAAGGPAAVKRCGPVFTDPFQTQPLLWQLHMEGPAIGIHPQPPGIVVTPLHNRGAVDPRFPRRLVHGHWIVRATCALNTT
jgi:hypothetical protein